MIVDAPSLGQRVVFPCGRWLDKDKDDGQLERELLPGVDTEEAYVPCKSIITCLIEWLIEGLIAHEKYKKQKSPPRKKGTFKSFESAFFNRFSFSPSSTDKCRPVLRLFNLPLKTIL